MCLANLKYIMEPILSISNILFIQQHICKYTANFYHQKTPTNGTLSDDEIPAHRSASVAKDHFFDDSPVVKSPPEPTRVKSPEQMNMRSPDPVNWTVPLDTGKTFTVTQNVKSGECRTLLRLGGKFSQTS